MMKSTLTFVCASLLTVLPLKSGGYSLSHAALAKSKKGSPYMLSSPQKKQLKDCTRLNGRYGYYANPWCTPSEQRRWDRTEARNGFGKS